MARSHMQWQFGAWDKPDHAQTGKDARHLYMVIVADETINPAGVVTMRLGLWAEEAAMSDDEAEYALFELEKRRFVVIDRRTNQLLVRTFIRNDGVYKQPNVLRSALSYAQTLRSVPIKRALAEELRKLPPKQPDKQLASGRMFVYPDPHETAAVIDPGPPPDGGGPSPKAFRKGSPEGSTNPADNPRSNGRHAERHAEPAEPFPEPLGEPQGEGEGVGEGELLPVGGHLVIKEAAAARAPADTRAPARETRPDVAVARLVGDALPRGVGRGARADLTSRCTRRHTEDDAPLESVRAALTRWSRETHVSPAAIEYMLDDAIKETHGAQPPARRQEQPRASAAATTIRGLQALKTGTDGPATTQPNLRALPGGDT